MPRLSDIRPAFYAALHISSKGKRSVATDDSVRYMALVKVIKEKKARTVRAKKTVVLFSLPRSGKGN